MAIGPPSVTLRRVPSLLIIVICASLAAFVSDRPIESVILSSPCQSIGSCPGSLIRDLGSCLRTGDDPQLHHFHFLPGDWRVTVIN
jgi:hypothetical protein